MAPAPRRPLEMSPRTQFVAPAVLFLGLMSIYAATACRTVGPGDSGELTTALSTWGVAHAPGFPLLSLIGNLVSHAVRASEPALILNLLNAAFAALACVVVADAVRVITASRAAGFIAGLALGTSRVFWLQALALEVFSLNALMAALLIDLLCRFLAGRSDPRSVAWTLPAAALVASTAVTHHLTLGVIALPVAAAFVFIAVRLPADPVPRRTWLEAALALLAGLAVLLYVPVAAHFHPTLNWGDVHDGASFMRLLMRRDFGSGTLMSPGIVVNQVLMNGEGAAPNGLRHFWSFWTNLPRDFGWLFPITAALGCAWTARHTRPLFAMAAGFAALLALFFTRVNTPFLPVFDRVTEAFFVLPHVVLAFLAGCGVAWLMDLGERARLHRALTGGLLALGTGFVMLFANWSRVDEHDNRFVRDFGAHLVAGMPPRSIFLSTGELFSNSLLYSQQLVGYRRDVSIVDQDLLTLDWYVHQTRGRVSVPGDPGSSLAWLDQHAGHSAPDPRPVLAVQLLDGSYAPSYRLQPLGIWSIAIPRDQQTDPRDWEREYSGIIRQWNPASLDRQYAPDSWEASEQIFYTYAIGQLEGLRDVVQAFASGPVVFTPVPALDHAAHWTRSRRADVLGFRSDFLRICVSDSLVRVTNGDARQIAAQAMSLADSTLAIDAGNIQALHAKAALMALRPELADSAAELSIRQRIVERRPGDFGELMPYFRLALSLQARDASGSIRQRADAVHQRLIRILRICAKLDPEPQVQRSLTYWSQPLEMIPSLR
ncbi:MAG TPA: DUF2723 domain-containing protein [Candidatus Udaeobacter sp.]|jgi:hypothetical protein|nr:DUF2723 domain-containing protein [Candidatus Udaeobacter sp.]